MGINYKKDQKSPLSQAREYAAIRIFKGGENGRNNQETKVIF